MEPCLKEKQPGEREPGLVSAAGQSPRALNWAWDSQIFLGTPPGLMAGGGWCQGSGLASYGQGHVQTPC